MNWQIEQPVILSGQTTSQVIHIGSAQKGAGASIQCPAAMTGATFTIKVSNRQGETAGNHVDALLTDNSGAISAFTFAANKAFNIPDEVFNHLSMVVVSASAEGADRTFALLAKYPV